MKVTSKRAETSAESQGLTSQASGDLQPHPRREILALTGVRAVAAIAVVLHHIQVPPSAPDAIFNVVNAGYIGVPLFFMLSGLVLAWNYPDLRPRAGGRALLRFYLARVARVMPLYWVVLAFLMLRTHMQGRAQAEWWLHALAVHTWSGDLRVGQRSYNGPAWSVCIEIFLYALFPLLVPVVAVLARRYGAKGLLALVGAAFAVQLLLCMIFAVKGWADLSPFDPRSGHRWLYRNPLTRIPDFVIGIAVAFLLMRGVTISRRAANTAQVGCVLAVLAVATIRPEGGLMRVLFYGAMWTLPFAVLLFSLAAAPAAGLSRFLATRVMVQLGAASYALYLTHRWLIDGFGAPLVRQDGIMAWAMMLAVLGLCLLLAEGAHRYVEVPARKGILRLAKRCLGQTPRPGRVPAQIEPASSDAGTERTADRVDEVAGQRSRHMEAQRPSAGG